MSVDRAENTGWIWGLDLSSKRLGVGLIHLPTGRFQTNLVQWATAKQPGNAHSLRACREKVHRFASALAGHFPPDCIAYEAPMGTHNNPVLVMHAGVCVEAVADATDSAPWPINISTWKQTVLGSGNAHQRELVPWARALGYHFTEDLDQLAGLAVAVQAAMIWDVEFHVKRLTPTPS